jgi:hypothetical protein
MTTEGEGGGWGRTREDGVVSEGEEGVERVMEG